MIRASRFLLPLLLLGAATASAAVSPTEAQKLYNRVSPSLVAVQYTWQNELGRHELIGAGIVVGEDGLVMAPLPLFGVQIPDEQMKEFKIIVPKQDEEPQELDAIFQGRDERTNVAFIKTKEPQKWAALQFAAEPVQIGEQILSVGLLPKAASYKPYFLEATVSASLRGETPQVLVEGGGLAALGSPVFDSQGKAIGIVSYQPGQSLLLNNPSEALAAINNPPRFFVPASDFLMSLSDPPTPEKPVLLPWMGVPQLTGLSKDVAEVFNLTNQPAVQVGEVIPGTPAEKAGLKQGDIVVKMDGKPLERGDEPSELPDIFRRSLRRMKPGTTVTLSVLRDKDQPLKDISITLAEQPPRANVAKRFWAEDLGMAVRDAVFADTYARKLAATDKGVVVALIRPQSAAETGGLHNNDFVKQINGMAVSNVDEFEKVYQQFRKEKPKDALVLVVLREGREQTIRIEPPQ